RHVAEADPQGGGEPSDVPEHVAELLCHGGLVDRVAMEQVLLDCLGNFACLADEAQGAVAKGVTGSRRVRIRAAREVLVRVEVHPALLKLSPAQTTTLPSCRMRSAIRSP